MIKRILFVGLSLIFIAYCGTDMSSGLHPVGEPASEDINTSGSGDADDPVLTVDADDPVLTVDADTTQDGEEVVVTSTGGDPVVADNDVLPVDGDSDNPPVDTGDDDTLPGDIDEVEDHKVYLCHKHKKTINVDSHALKAHLKHGDYLGECE